MLKKKIKQLLIGTNNKGKLKEIRDLLPANIKTFPTSKFNLKSPREIGKTFKENSLIKSQYFSKKTNLICLADDSGLEIDILNKKQEAIDFFGLLWSQTFEKHVVGTFVDDQYKMTKKQGSCKQPNNDCHWKREMGGRPKAGCTNTPQQKCRKKIQYVVFERVLLANVKFTSCTNNLFHPFCFLHSTVLIVFFVFVHTL